MLRMRNNVLMLGGSPIGIIATIGSEVVAFVDFNETMAERGYTLPPLAGLDIDKVVFAEFSEICRNSRPTGYGVKVNLAYAPYQYKNYVHLPIFEYRNRLVIGLTKPAVVSVEYLDLITGEIFTSGETFLLFPKFIVKETSRFVVNARIYTDYPIADSTISAAIRFEGRIENGQITGVIIDDRPHRPVEVIDTGIEIENLIVECNELYEGFMMADYRLLASVNYAEISNSGKRSKSNL